MKKTIMFLKFVWLYVFSNTDKKINEKLKNVHSKSFTEIFEKTSFSFVLTGVVIKRNIVWKIWFGVYVLLSGFILFSIIANFIKFLINQNHGEVLNNITIIISGPYILIKVVISVVKKSLILDIITDMNNDFKSVRYMEEQRQEILNKWIKDGLKTDRFFFKFFCWVSITYICYSCIIFTDIKSLGLLNYHKLTPLLNNKAMYPISVIVNIATMIMVWGTLSFTLVVIKHELGLLEAVKWDFRQLFYDSPSHEEVMTRLAIAVERHQKILLFHKKIQKLMSQTFSSTVVASIISFSICAFQVQKAWSDGLSVAKYYDFLFTFNMTLFELILPCWYGTRIYYLSSSVCEAVFFSNWESRPDIKRYKTSLLIVMMRARRPLQFTGLNTIRFNLELYAAVVNISYSVLNLLKSVSIK